MPTSYAAVQLILDELDEELLSKLVQSADDDGPAAGSLIGAAGQGRIQKELDGRTRDMNAILQGVYVVPVTGPASALDALSAICVHLTMWGLFKDRLIGEKYESFRADKDDALKTLRGYLTGNLAGAARISDGAPLATSDGFAGSDEPVYGSTDGWL